MAADVVYDEDMKVVNDECNDANGCPESANHDRFSTKADSKPDFGHDNSTAPSTWKNAFSQLRTYIEYTLNVVFRSLGVIDLLTDCLLLAKAVNGDIHDHNGRLNQGLFLFILSLMISIVSPYIIQYSSGIQCFLYKKTFDNFKGFYKIFTLLYMFPTGVPYFVFLEILDVFVSIYLWFQLIFLNKSKDELKTVQQSFAEQVGLTRMNWQGFKRQKSITQLAYETVPQLLIQSFLYFDLINARKVANISHFDLALSMTSALVNTIYQLFRLKMESKLVKESFVEYCLVCAIARTKWYPFQNILSDISGKDYYASNRSDECLTLLYSPRMNWPLLEFLGFKQPRMEFDFSHVTIKHFVAKLANVHSNVTLSIDFGHSLRLLSFEDKLSLFLVCQEKKVNVMNIDQIDWVGAMKYTYVDTNDQTDMKKDCRVLTNARNEHGSPLIVEFMSLSDSYVTQVQKQQVLQSGFDINLSDKATGHNLIMLLIEQKNFEVLDYIFGILQTIESMTVYLNFYDKSGKSPMFYALHQYVDDTLAADNLAGLAEAAAKSDELKIDQSNNELAPASNKIKSPRVKRHMYEYLLQNGASPQFPITRDQNGRNVGQAPLGFALQNQQLDDANKIKLGHKLLDLGCRLTASEFVTMMPNLCMTSIMTNDIDYLDLVDHLNHCHSTSRVHARDIDGNNPLHLYCLHLRWLPSTNASSDNQDNNDEKTADDAAKPAELVNDVIDRFKSFCPHWLGQENKVGLIPVALAIEFRQLRVLKCLLTGTSSCRRYLLQLCENDKVIIWLSRWIAAVVNTLVKQDKLLTNFGGKKILTLEKSQVASHFQSDARTGYLRTLIDLFMWTNPAKVGKMLALNREVNILINQKIFETLANRHLHYCVVFITGLCSSELSKTLPHETMKQILGTYNYRIQEWSKKKANGELGDRVISAEPDDFDNKYADDMEPETARDSATNSEDDIKADYSEDDVLDDTKQSIQSKNQDIDIFMSDVDKAEPLTWLERMYSTFVESLSSLDLVTDMIVLIELYNGGHVLWTSSMVLMIISPYLVSFAVLGTLFQKKMNRSVSGDSNTIKFLCCLLLTPASLLYFLLIDDVASLKKFMKL